MTNPTLDRDVAEKIVKLVSTYETRVTGSYFIHDMGIDEPDELLLPMPDFGEVIRILPKIDAAIWRYRPTGYPLLTFYSAELVRLYMLAPTPEQGMKDVSDYIRKLL